MSYYLCSYVHRRMNLFMRDLLPFPMALYPESNLQLSLTAGCEGRCNSHTLPSAKHALFLWLRNGFPFQSRSKTCSSVCFPPGSLKPGGTGLLSKLALAARTKILGLKKSPQKYMLYNNRLPVILMGWLNSRTPSHQCLKLKEQLLGLPARWWVTGPHHHSASLRG